MSVNGLHKCSVLATIFICYSCNIFVKSATDLSSKLQVIHFSAEKKKTLLGQFVETGQSSFSRGKHRSCLGWVFHIKSGSFADNTKIVQPEKWPLLTLKTQPRFHPFNWSLSMLFLHSHLYCFDWKHKRQLFRMLSKCKVTLSFHYDANWIKTNGHVFLFVF
jgi:hypothetical protein